jgi:hypothetical protein
VLGEPPGYDAHPLVKFVARSYAEFCAIVGLLVGAAILFMA